MSHPNKKAFAFSLIVAIGGLVFGLDLVLIAGTFDYTEIQFGLNAAQKGLIASGPGWGALAALAFAGWVCDRIGRKKTLLVIAALYTISAIGSSLSWGFWSLFLFRLIGGLAFTSLSLASMYIGEIAPPEIRGKLVGSNQLNIAVGIFAGSGLNYLIADIGNSNVDWASAIFLNDQTAWRWMLGIETLPAIIWFLLLLTIPESPRWLVLNDKTEQARSVLAKITPAHKVQEQLDEILRNLKDIHHSLNYAQQAKLLFSRKLWVALAVGLILAWVQPWTGMNPLQSFMPQIFEYAGRGETKLLDQFIINLVGMFFTLLAILVIDKIGRRIILIGGLAACASGWLLVAYGFGSATYSVTPEVVQAIPQSIDPSGLSQLIGQVFDNEMTFKSAIRDSVGADVYNQVESAVMLHGVSMNAVLVLAGIVLFVCAFNFSAGPVLWILFSELFPTKVRALAITGCAWVTTIFGGIVVQQLFPLEIEWFGSTVTFIIYGTFCLLGMIALAKLTPETKGKSIEEIEAEIERLSNKA
ncbi:MFS transporter [Pelagicoccus sp. SDUM812003]|uniref:MFS transporter n=1 Tax=Pelagicoccus sp. SDUM812003 TaxID=3041267 RepID=UPI00280DE8FF|nr:MFS transporter [Pelagicoccus sp. SDUM812003]MDQ8201424.1 MFS transporter [Pelagicoccus sp. SDUM812003]